MKTAITIALFAVFAATSAAALADEPKPYKEGAITEVSYIRTKPGHFSEYMKFLATTYKTEMEAYKKAGLITDYAVYGARPHSPSDADLVLTITYPNYATLDRIGDFEAIDAKIEGSLQASEKGFGDRQAIRETLGSELIQELKLK